MLDSRRRSSLCPLCRDAPAPEQCELFDAERFRDSRALTHRELHQGPVLARQTESLPPIATSTCGREGFWRECTPAVFGQREGVGPLLIMPDTNFLIRLREEIDEVQGGAGLTLHAHWSSRSTPCQALVDVVQLWWWRDVRFRVGDEHLKDDRRKRMSAARQRAREAAVHELDQDFADRGGFQPIVDPDEPVCDALCAIHVAGHAEQRRQPSAGHRWPRDALDRALVREAYETGCHVFLTEDKGILRSHGSLGCDGLAILTPAQLIDALDESGELPHGNMLDHPAPDISAIARIYAGFSTG